MPCLGWRAQTGGPYSWKTFAQVHEDLLDVGSALLNVCGLRPNEENMVGLYANNCVEWTVVDFASAAYGLVSVTM